VIGWLLLVPAPPIAPAQEHDAELAAAPRISIRELTRLLDQARVVLLDVRSRLDYQRGHIPGALSMPLELVGQNADALRMVGQPIVTYCA